jgi:Spy/CpxP family protein refolding chaperone
VNFHKKKKIFHLLLHLINAGGLLLAEKKVFNFPNFLETNVLYPNLRRIPMKTKITFLAVSVLVLIGLCFSAQPIYAYSGPHGRGGGIWHISWILKKGGQPLTEEQKAQIKTILTTSWTQLKPTRTELRTDRQALRDLILSGKASEDQIKAQVDGMIHLGTDLAEQRAQTYNRIVKVLTADQLSLLQQFKGHKIL